MIQNSIDINQQAIVKLQVIDDLCLGTVGIMIVVRS